MDKTTVFIIIYVIAFFEMTIGWSFNQKYKTYRLYQSNLKTYTFFILCAALLTVLPVIKIVRHEKLNGQEFFFSFIIYLILFKVIDLISKMFNKRPIIIATRYDNEEIERSWLDILLSVIALVGTFYLTMLVGYIYEK